MTIKFVDRFSKIPPVDWQRLNDSNSPLLSYEFFNALERSGSVSATQGWQPHHLTISEQNNISAIMPMYIKQHSWGEYVFDWVWAEAYQRHQLSYYPKLVATTPFTPITSSKLLSSHYQQSDLFTPLSEYCLTENINSWHLLFCPELSETEQLALPDDVYQRHSVQFNWFNRGYRDFDELLASFTARKRKSIKKERASIKNQGIDIRQVQGTHITTKELEFFYLNYQLTYFKRGHTAHLSFNFFYEILKTLANNILLFIARKEQNDIACAWFFYDDSHLYGRYWGCTAQISNLHFELCYYQGIEYCIENNLSVFNPGTQGEHKIRRGFEPILTHSYHWIKHPAFKPAIKEYCAHERMQMLRYQEQCRQLLPFNINEMPALSASK